MCLKRPKEHVVLLNTEIETTKEKKMKLPVLKHTASTVAHTLDGLMSRLNTVEANKIKLENMKVAITLRKA